ncbi:MAG: hypothetical protein QME21_01435 [Anaerolineales bacterium]|nr:hypothetical protein [Anaerolineales bacterium]
MEWSFRDEFLVATHRWYLIMLCCLLGSLAGWSVAMLWPSPVRVTKELFVGLNVYQSSNDRGAIQHAGLPFQNANDYKNWQMASLNTVIYMDSILDETLARLRTMDAYWQGVSREELAEMLHVYWRNAGKWRLVARHENQTYATQAVLAWQDVIVERVHFAVAEAQNALLFASQLEALAGARAVAEQQHALLQQAKMQLEGWRSRLTDQSPLGDDERMRLWMEFAQVAEGDRWRLAKDAFPMDGSPNRLYLAWLEEVLPLLDQEIDLTQKQIEAQDQQYAELSAQYSRALDASLGLSAELLVQKISDRKLQLTVERPTGVLILIGAAIGWIVWAMGWLIRPALRMTS